MKNYKGEELLEISDLPFRYKLPGENRYLNWEYWNANGLGLYVMAVLTTVKDKDGGEYVFDWACYIGGSQEGAKTEFAGVESVFRQGAKLRREIAIAFFPAYAQIDYRP